MASYDWSVPVRSLLAKFQEAGFNITHVVHEGKMARVPIDQTLSKTKIRHLAADLVVSTKKSSVFIDKDEMRAGLVIVLDNEPKKIVAEYLQWCNCTFTTDPQLEKLLKETIDNYSRAWEGIKCPMIAD